MDLCDEVLSFMDLLDLDEELIDARLKSIMIRNSHSNTQLAHILHLVQYKHLINLQEDTECENDEEYNFTVKLIHKVNEENVENICMIIKIVLSLNKSTIISKSEHLLQQILSNISLSGDRTSKEILSDGSDGDNTLITILGFKLIESVVDATLKNGEKLSLLFLETPLETVLSSSDDKLKTHFLTNTVPKLFEGIIGYNILDRIWSYLKNAEEHNKEYALKVLSCLSEFYLPVPDSKGNLRFISEIAYQYEFWKILLLGLKSSDSSIRKISVYLMKRTIDCLIAYKKDVLIKSETERLFLWNNENPNHQVWDNFFVLIDSLEEKQSNIVLPSLRLFDAINGIENCWLNCAFNIGLKHDNTQVRNKCIEYRLKNGFNNEEEAVVLLEALNDINLYDNTEDTEVLTRKLSKKFENIYTFVYFFKGIPKLKWSPIPLFYLSNALTSLKLDLSRVIDNQHLTQIIIDILNVNCNIVPVRKAVKINISYFIGNCCRQLTWSDLMHIYCSLKWETIFSQQKNIWINSILNQNLKLTDIDKEQFFNHINYTNIDFVLLYLYNHENDLHYLITIVKEMILKLQDIVNRQYSDKKESFADIVFLLHLFSKNGKYHDFNDPINIIIAREYKTILKYILCMLSSDIILTMEEIILLLKEFEVMSVNVDNEDSKDIIYQLYKSALLFLRDENTELEKKVISVVVINILSKNSVINAHHKHEMLNLKRAIKTINEVKLKDTQNMESNGRLRNLFYEKSCELVYYLIKEEVPVIRKDVEETMCYVENVIEYGGYGCLKWILKMMNKMLPALLSDDDIYFDLTKFINRVWKEIEELKSNNQYSPCIEEFVNLITQKSLLKKSMYNNVIILYCNKIIEYGAVKNTPLYFLVRKLNSMEISEDFGQIIYVLSEILMFSPVPRKDQRIADNVTVKILKDPKYELHNKDTDIHFNYQIQYLGISTLCRIAYPEKLEIIASSIMKKLEEMFRNKQRYHGNSQVHRTLLIGLQHLLLISVLNLKIISSQNTASWCIQFLGRLPHQPSIRICLEWIIALHLYVKKTNLNDDLVQLLQSKSVPVTSQFTILYWVLKHKLLNATCTVEEYEIVMNLLLSHTMGQMFSVRLNAQYLATKLNKINTVNVEKYAYIIGVIEKTFEESSNDKNFIKLKGDFFVNNFDIIESLTPSFIYYFFPKYCEIGINEISHQSYIRYILDDVNQCINKNTLDCEFNKEWTKCHKSEDDVFNYKFTKNSESNGTVENGEFTATIQKKYIPWKNMSDIDVYEAGKKKENSGEMIVVASLIDKLPNLGGMARTSEVFGVNTYIVDSLKHLQDKQFQGLSVSAERWVHIEEVRPGSPLKEYLMRKKAEGYSVVAAEQTSTSYQLQSFKFPKKTLLLLGHEKEGIPCDLLPLMDHCVEIPQQGFVRSLNVHVTAAIFVWEYTRQNIL